jgi:hypothetical protein
MTPHKHTSSHLIAGLFGLASVLATASCGGSSAPGGAPDSGGTREDASGSTKGDAGSDDASGALADGAADGLLPTPEGGAADASTSPMQCASPTAEAGAVVVPAPVCSALTPSSSVIAAFDGASPAAFAPWGTAPLVGGTYVYPTCSTTPPEPTDPLFADYSASNWHITGTVGAYSGFGVWWVLQSGTTTGGYPTYAAGPVDASAYLGIQFDISGDPGPLGALTFVVESANQQSPVNSQGRPTCGTCDPDAGACDLAALASVAGFASAPRTVQIRWADLTSTRGPALAPAKLVAIFWTFPWIPGGTPYPVDVTIGNVKFIEASAGEAGTD